MRRFVIGDIHGCSKALRSLIAEIRPQPSDELIFLGDYVDRGPDSRDVVDQLVELHDRCRLVALRGNHEIMLMGVALGGLDGSMWLTSGGQATVNSYGGSLDKIPAKHLAFFQELRPYYETSDSIFVHASYDFSRPMSQQGDAALYWTHLAPPIPPPHQSGKRVYVGHTPQGGGDVLDLGHLVCVDTYCFGGGYLTALDVQTQDVIQTDRQGHLRRSPIRSSLGRLAKYGRAVIEQWRHSRLPENGQTNGKKVQTNGTANGHANAEKLSALSDAPASSPRPG